MDWRAKASLEKLLDGLLDGLLVELLAELLVELLVGMFDGLLVADKSPERPSATGLRLRASAFCARRSLTERCQATRSLAASRERGRNFRWSSLPCLSARSERRAVCVDLFCDLNRLGYSFC